MRLRSIVAAAALALLILPAFAQRKTPVKGTRPGQLKDKVAKHGHIQVIIGARDDEWEPEGTLSAERVEQQRRRGKTKVAEIIKAYPNMKAIPGWQFETVPAFVAEVRQRELLELLDDERVLSIEEDVEVDLTLAQSTVTIGANSANSAGYSGAGQIVVVIDRGVDSGHPFFGSPTRVRDGDGACFSGERLADLSEIAGNYQSLCPGGGTREFGAGTGAPCRIGDLSSPTNPCHHGTKVAGVIAGDNGKPLSDPDHLKGVAPAAQIIPIQTGSKICSAGAPDSQCQVRGLKASVLFALDDVASRLIPLHSARDQSGNVIPLTTSIAAVNISLAFAGSQYAAPCDDEHWQARNAVANVTSHNVAVVVATGNNANTSGISAPACLSKVIAVSATDDADHLPPYANNAAITDLFAPGGADLLSGTGIYTSQNSGCTGCTLYVDDAGTSMAAPHVSGALALLRQRHKPESTSIAPSWQSLLGMLVRTGVMVTDTRSGASNVQKPRINVNEALDQPLQLPAPSALNASAATTTSVSLAWLPPAAPLPRTEYKLRVRNATGEPSWADLASTTATTYSHGTLNAGAVYEYEVTNTDAAGNFSAPVRDTAYTGFFSNDPIVSGVTAVRGAHVGELRQCTDAWRTFAGLPRAFVAPYEALTGTVFAAHIADIVLAFNAARQTAGFPPFSYSGVAAPTAGVIIDRRHIEQLRDAMR